MLLSSGLGGYEVLFVVGGYDIKLQEVLFVVGGRFLARAVAGVECQRSRVAKAHAIYYGLIVVGMCVDVELEQPPSISNTLLTRRNTVIKYLQELFLSGTTIQS